MNTKVNISKKTKRRLAFFLAFILAFPVNFLGTTVQGQNNIDFLTDVHLEDEQGNNLLGKEVDISSDVTLVYSYELHSMQEQPPNLPEDGAENDTPEDKPGTSTPDNGADTTTPDDGADTTTPDDGADTTTPDDGADTTTPDDGADTTTPDDGADTTTPDDGADTTTPDDGADTTTPDDGADTTTPDDGADTTTPDDETDSSIDAISEDQSISIASIAKNVVQLFHTTAYAAEENLTYTIEIPNEFNPYAAQDGTITDETGLPVGNYMVNETDNKVIVTFHTKENSKGEIRIKAGINSTLISETGARDIIFPIGNNTPITIPVNFSVISMLKVFPKGTEMPLNFLTDAKLVDNAEVDYSKKTGVTVQDAVRIQYSYMIPTEGGIYPGIQYTFQVPEELVIKDVAKRDFQLIDNGFVVANGSVDADNNAYIEFVPEAEAKNYLKPGTEGGFYVEAGFSEEHIKNGGKQTITIKNGDDTDSYPCDVNFKLIEANAEIGITKKAKENGVDLQDGTIAWEVTVKPKLNNVWDPDREIVNFVITDTITSNNMVYVEDSVEILDSEDNPVTDEFTFEFNSEGTSFTATSSGLSMDSTVEEVYTLNYKTQFKLSAWTGESATFTNTAKAKFQYPNYTIDPNTGKAELLSDPDTNWPTKESSPVNGTKEIKGGFLTKKGASQNQQKEIKWTLNINAEGFAIDNAVITDKIQVAGKDPENLEFSSIEIWNAEKNTDGTLKKKDLDSSISPSNNGIAPNLELALGYITEPKIIEYITTVDETYWKSNQTSNFKNVAVLTGDSSIGEQLSIKADDTVEIGNNLITKSGIFNAKNHTIDWTININKDKFELTDAVVTDILPDSVTYIENTLLASGADAVDITGNTIKITYPSSFDESSTITYSTFVNDPKYWAVNYSFDSDNPPVSNTATLTADGMTDNSYNATESPVINSTVIKKTSGDYNSTTKIAGWKVTINQNKMKMTNPIITDIISDNQEYVEGSVTGDTKNIVYNKDRKELIIELDDIAEGSAPQTITYETKFISLDQLENNSNLSIENTAILTCKEMGESLNQPSTAKKPISKSMLEKKGALIKDENSLEWTVTINRNLIPMNAPLIVDELPEGLILRENSVTLNKLTFEGTKEVETPVTFDYSDYTSYKDGVFQFQFKEKTSDAYVLRFKTYFEKAIRYTNGIKLNGVGGGVAQSSNAVSASFSSAGGWTKPPKEGKIVITKVDEDNNPIKGAVFQLGSSKTEETDENGIATFTGLWPDNYIITEISAPQQYIIDQTPQTVTVGANKTVSITVINKNIKGNFEVVKRDADSTPPNYLEGAEISIYQLINGVETFIVKEKTNDTGKVLFTDLKYGNYIAKETIAPSGYALSDETYSFSIEEAGKTITWNFTNSKIKGDIKVTVIDSQTNQPIQEAKVIVKDKSDTAIQYEKDTDKNGTILFSNLPMGTYIIEESTTPEGYLPSNESKEVTLEESSTTASVELKNIRIKGSLEVTRKNIEDGSEQYLKGSEISLYKVENDVETLVAKEKTDAQGKVVFQDLFYGNYVARETVAPEGYMLNKEQYEFSIIEHDEIIKWDLVSTKTKGSIRVAVKEVDTGEPLENALISVVDKSNPSIHYEKRTNSDGETLFDGLNYGQYIVSEVEVPDGFVILEESKTATIQIDSENPFILFEHPRVKGNGEIRVAVKEVDTGKPLQNALISVVSKNNPSIHYEKRTNNDGETLFDGLNYGQYIVSEVEVPDGFVILEESKTTTIQVDNEKAFVLFEHPHLKGTGEIRVAVKEVCTGKPLQNALISVVNKSNPSIHYEKRTNSDGETLFDGLNYGEYIISEVEVPDGFVLLKGPKTATIQVDNEKAFILFENPCIKGDIRVAAKEVETGEALPNVLISVVNKNNPSIHYEKRANSDGEVLFEGLSYGEYTVSEVEVPDGFVMLEEAKPANIQIQGEKVFILFENPRVKGDLKVTVKQTSTEIILPNAKIALYNKDGILIEEKVTGDDGTVSFVTLLYGDYYYQQKEASAGYQLDNTKYEFKIEKNNFVVEKILENNRYSSGDSGGGSQPETAPDINKPDVSEQPKPSPDVSKPKPSPDVSKPKPSPDVSKPKPSPDVPKQKPSPDVPKQKPSPDVPKQKPSPDVPKQKPSPDVPKQKPSPAVSEQPQILPQGSNFPTPDEPSTSRNLSADGVLPVYMQTIPSSLTEESPELIYTMSNNNMPLVYKKMLNPETNTYTYELVELDELDVPLGYQEVIDPITGDSKYEFVELENSMESEKSDAPIASFTPTPAAGESLPQTGQKDYSSPFFVGAAFCFVAALWGKKRWKKQ